MQEPKATNNLGVSSKLMYAAAIGCFVDSLFNVRIIIGSYNGWFERTWTAWFVHELLGNALICLAVLVLQRHLVRGRGIKGVSIPLLLLAATYAIEPFPYLFDRLYVSGVWAERALSYVSVPMKTALFGYLFVRLLFVPDRTRLLKFYCALQATAFLWGLLLPLGELGFVLLSIGNVLLGIYFVRTVRVDEVSGNGRPQDERRPDGARGGLRYFMLTTGFTILATAMSVPVMSADRGTDSAFFFPAVMLTGPQWWIIELQMMSEDLSSIFFTSALYFPVLLFPIGLYLVRGGRLWVAIILQSVFAVVHVLASFAMLIAASMS